VIPLNQIFEINYGDRGYSNKSVLDNGGTLLIASQGVENGAYGFCDIPATYHPPIITVPRTGSIGYAFVQLHTCNITDDCMVLIPKRQVTTEYLFYVASVIRIKKWRFNYARKITPDRLGKLEVIPFENFETDISYTDMFQRLYPQKNSYEESVSTGEPRFKRTEITRLFDLERGHFHAIDKLKEGGYPTISRVSKNNGLVGFYQKPERAKVFPKHIITVSTVTGDAFIQYTPFIATDNVVMCVPKRAYRITTLVYIQTWLNKVKWRYSYGRQCYKRTFQKTEIFLPWADNGELNEDSMEYIVTNQPYWKAFKETLVDS